MPSFRARLHASVVGSISFSLVVSTMPTPAAADPTDGKVVAGAATITERVPGTVVVTQTTQRAIIDWGSFNIGENETTRFDQPNASSIALNRITGGAPTTIQGSLLANGQVWLINPNGIAFGRSARVDVAGLIATTLDIDNRDFMTGRYTFAGPAGGQGMVANAGHITIKDAGLAALVAPGVENSGIIEAHYGRVTLGSATGFTVDFYGDGLTRFLASGRVAGALENLGNDRGRVAITTNAAKAIVDGSINLDGASEATGLNVSGGSITLTGPATGYVSVSGTVDTSRSNGAGGRIDVAAKDVRLASTTILNASGFSQGGIVRIGGDWHGQGDIPTASTTTIDDGALVRVDAAEGNAGSAVVWSDNQTRFAGTILATGDTSGGSVEVSGKRQLDYAGTTDLRSASGHVGSLLLDPQNVRIATTGATPTLPANGAINFQPSDADSILSVATLQNALALGNVTVTTGTTGTQAGDITVANSFSWSSGNSLSLEAFRNITVGDGVTVTNTGAGNLTLRADSTGTGAGTVTFTGGGNINYSGSTGHVSILYNPSGGYGTPTNFSPSVSTNGAMANQPFYGMLVNNVSDLQNLGANLSGSYALGRDIDGSSSASLNQGRGFITINNDPFVGILDGLGHTINGLAIAPLLDTGGLFGTIGPQGIVRHLSLNLTVSYLPASSVDNSPYVWNYFGALAGSNKGSVDDAHVTLIFSFAPGSRMHTIGGLVGTNSGRIANSSTNVDITIGESGTNSVGGIVGANTGFIENSYSAGRITISGQHHDAFLAGSFYGGIAGDSSGQINTSNSSLDIGQGPNFGLFGSVGGLVGRNQGTIRQSFANGNVTLSAGNLGGLVGENDSVLDASIYDSYATGSVGSTDFSSGNGIGGLVGNDSGYNGYAGGVIQNSFATGRIIRSSNAPLGQAVGGLIGVNGSATPSTGGGTFTGPAGPVTNSYWDTQLSGVDVSAGGVGLTTAQLKAGLPAGFDPSIWAINSGTNGGYPYLKWEQGSVTTPPAPTAVVFGTGVAPPPPPPPPPSLTVGTFGTSFSTSAAPYQPTIALSGSGFGSVSEVRLTWTDPNGQTGTVIWNAANDFGGGRFAAASDTSATISPVLVAAQDPSGTYQWTVTFVAGAQTVSRNFAVTYAPSVTEPTPALGAKVEIDQTMRPPGDPRLVVPTLHPQVPTQADLIAYERCLWSGCATPRDASGGALSFAYLADAAYGTGPAGVTTPDGRFWSYEAGWEDILARLLSKSFPAIVVRATIAAVRASGFYAALYESNGQYVLTFRGTEGALNIPDVVTDLLHLAGAPTIQYGIASYITAQLSLEHPGLILTGHSLGGGLAQYAASTSPNYTRAVVFNPAGSSYSVSNILTSLTTSNVVEFKIANDPVSLAGIQYGKTYTLPADRFFQSAVTSSTWAESPILRAYQLYFAHVGTTPTAGVIAALADAVVYNQK